MTHPFPFSLFQLLLFSFVLITSCNGQKKADQPKEGISAPESLTDNRAEKDPYFVESLAITTSSGPKSITRNILEDRQGNIWLATWEGIMRYEPSVDKAGGKAFTNFTNKEGLRRFHVFCILEDRSGNIWFGTIGAGLYRYDPSADKAGGESFTNFTTVEGLPHDGIICIYEDEAGKIWIGTEGGLSCYDGKSFSNITIKDGLPNNNVNSIQEDQAGNLWLGTRGEACIYDRSADEADGKVFQNLKNKEGLAYENVRSIIKDQNGNMWFGGNNGLWRYDGQSFSQYGKRFVGYIYEDRTGNIWTSSEGGDTMVRHWVLSRYDKKYLHDEKAKATQINNEGKMFFGILEDREGGIWWGSLKGVCRYDPSVEKAGGTAFNCFD